MSSELSSKMRANMAEIYRLVDRQPVKSAHVTSSQLADWLFVSPPAVNRMVNRLSELGLLVHRPYHGITITDAGRREALKRIRSQRIAETFLVQVMGFNWLTVHEEALRLSDGLSEAVIQRMYEMTGAPTTCPHGEPIPDAQGALPPARDVLLSQIDAGKRIRVTRLITRESDRLQYIAALGLVPGKVCDVIHVAPFDGPRQLKLGQEFRIIGHSLAQLIRAEIVA